MGVGSSLWDGSMSSAASGSVWRTTSRLRQPECAGPAPSCHRSR